MKKYLKAVTMGRSLSWRSLMVLKIFPPAGEVSDSLAEVILTPCRGRGGGGSILCFKSHHLSCPDKITYLFYILNVHLYT